MAAKKLDPKTQRLKDKDYRFDHRKDGTPTFKIFYNDLRKDDEEVQAAHYRDVKSWIVFEQDDESAMPTEILRIKTNEVSRIERTAD